MKVLLFFVVIFQYSFLFSDQAKKVDTPRGPEGVDSKLTAKDGEYKDRGRFFSVPLGAVGEGFDVVSKKLFGGDKARVSQVYEEKNVTKSSFNAGEASARSSEVPSGNIVYKQIQDSVDLLNKDLAMLSDERDRLLDQVANGDQVASRLLDQNGTMIRITDAKLQMTVLEKNLDRLTQKKIELQGKLKDSPNDEGIKEALAKVEDLQKNLKNKFEKLSETVKLENEFLSLQKNDGALQDELERLKIARADLLTKLSDKSGEVIKELELITKKIEELNDTILRLQESRKYLETDILPLLTAEIEKRDAAQNTAKLVLEKSLPLQDKYADLVRKGRRTSTYRPLKEVNDRIEKANSILQEGNTSDQLREQLKLIKNQIKKIIKEESKIKGQYDQKADEYNEKIIQLDDAIKESEEAIKNSKELQETDLFIKGIYDELDVNNELMMSNIQMRLK